MKAEEIAQVLREHVTCENQEPMLRAIMGALMEKFERTSVIFYAEEAAEKQRKETALFERFDDEPAVEALERARDDLDMLKHGDDANFEATWLLRDRPDLPEGTTVQEQLDKALGDLALLEKEYGKDKLLEYLENCGLR